MVLPVRGVAYVILAYLSLGVQIGLSGFIRVGGAPPNLVLIAALLIALNAPKEPALLGCFGAWPDAGSADAADAGYLRNSRMVDCDVVIDEYSQSRSVGDVASGYWRRSPTSQSTHTRMRRYPASAASADPASAKPKHPSSGRLLRCIQRDEQRRDQQTVRRRPADAK